MSSSLVRYENSAQAAADFIIRNCHSQANLIIKLVNSGNHAAALDYYVQLANAISQIMLHRFQPVFTAEDDVKSQQPEHYIFHPALCAAEALCRKASKSLNGTSQQIMFNPPITIGQASTEDKIYGVQFSETSAFGSILDALGHKPSQRSSKAKQSI